MASSWFRSNSGGRMPGNSNSNNNNTFSSSNNNNNKNKPTVQEVIKFLYPKKKSLNEKTDDRTSSSHRTRFSTLCLEHGEKVLQDWAVVANSTLVSSSSSSSLLPQANTTAENNNDATTTAAATAASSLQKSNKIQWAQSSLTTTTTTSPEKTSNKTLLSSRYTTSASLSFSNNNDNNNNAGTTKVVDKDSFPSVHMNKIEGRLHLCTRSVVFEPLEQFRPMVRCPLVDIVAPGPREYPPISDDDDDHVLGDFQGMCVEFHATRHVTMKANNVIGPFTTVKDLCVRFCFTFLHSSPTPFCELSQRLYALAMATSRKHHKYVPPSTSSSNNSSSNDNNNNTTLTPLQELDAITKKMLERPFCHDNLVDVHREVPLTTNLQCHVCTPLQSKPGVLVLTEQRIYFQPATGIVMTKSSTSTSTSSSSLDEHAHDETIRAWSWSQADVVATARRYHGLRDSALEIYWRVSDSSKSRTSTRSSNAGGGGGGGGGASSTLVAFERRHDREQVLRLLPATAPCVTDRDFLIRVVEEWHAGNLSNYDYLLALNSAAGRSFHDLSRYPVFPWVISDYTSEKLDLKKEATFRDLCKPVGALNPERLEYFMTRFHNMQDMENEAPFLYGTHYSAPAYVLYFLVRVMPEHMLCLQNGKMDESDRLFHSIKKCYECVLSAHADVKELIPEFFYSGSSGPHDANFDFLLNARALHLGATQTGDRVHHVQLPPWAHDSAREFCKKNRKALESDICTRNLPSWIDLIFGAKSRGAAAMEAANLFHRTAYLGPRDLADMKSQEERFHAELQASEFGIVPDLLFTGPHPLQKQQCETDFNIDDMIAPDVGRASSRDDSISGKDAAWELLDPPALSAPGSGTDGSNQHDVSQQLQDQAQQQDHHQLLNEGAETLAKDQFNTGRRTVEEDQYNPDIMAQQEAAGGVGSSEVSLTKQQQNSLPLRGAGDTANRMQGSFYSSNEASLATSPATSSDQYAMSSQQQQQASPSSPPRVPGPVSSSVTSRTEWDMKIIERRRIHNDALSGCVLLIDDEMPSRSILATTSLDGGLMAHKVSLGEQQQQEPELEQESDRGVFSRAPFFSYSTILSRNQATSSSAQPSKLTEYRTHSSRDPLACLVLASDGAEGHVAFCGGHDDVVLAYGINSACAVASVYSHRDAVTGLELIPRTPFDGESSLWLDNSTHLLVSGSWDATVKVFSACVSAGETVAIQREPLVELFDADSSIVCVSAKSIATTGIVIGAGCADGSFCVWNVHGDGVRVVLHNEPARRGSGKCSVVKWISEGGNLHLFCAFSTGKVASYTLVDGVLQRVGAVSVGVAVLSLAYSSGVLLVGCSDGGLRLLPVRGGASFEGKPTLWQAVNDKSSPGISCISLSYTRPEHAGDQHGRCFCSTGAEDGSVALFELKRVVH